MAYMTLISGGDDISHAGILMLHSFSFFFASNLRHFIYLFFFFFTEDLSKEELFNVALTSV